MNFNEIHAIGVPWDEKSSFMRGCADAPNIIWDAFNCDSANTCAENGHDLGMNEKFIFKGNMRISSGNKVIDEIAEEALAIATKGVFPIFLGGEPRSPSARCLKTAKFPSPATRIALD